MRDWPRDSRGVQYPSRDGRGGNLGGAHLGHAPNRVIVGRTINNVTVINNIHVRLGMGGHVPGSYYWYYDNGMRYAHHYDAYRVHWFGFYLGDVYFWTRWHNDRLWWQDSARGRWLCYREGQWWWQDGSVVYIYRDGSYYRWTPVRGGYEAQPEPPTSAPTPSPAPAPSEPEEKTEFYSEDGSRLVKIFGEKREAFLYDNTGEEPAFLAFLAEGAEAVQFSSEGALTVLVTVASEDGGKSFKLFDASGKEFGAPEDEVKPDSQLGESPAFKNLQTGTPF